MDARQEAKELWEKSKAILDSVEWKKSNPHEGMTLYNGKCNDWRFNSIRMFDRGSFIYEGVLIHKNTIVRLSIEDWAKQLFESAQRAKP